MPALQNVLMDGYGGSTGMRRVAGWHETSNQHDPPPHEASPKEKGQALLAEQADTEAWAVFGVSFFKAHFCMGCNVLQSVESTCDFSESTLLSSAVVESQNAAWLKS